MRSLPLPRLILVLVLAPAFFIRTGTPAFAQPAAVSVPTVTPIPYHGLRDIGVTITPNSVNASQTTIWISDPARLKVGQIVETQDASREIMQITGLSSSTMDVVRGVLGTSAATHNIGTALFSDFTAVNVNVSGVGYRDTGATLSTDLDTTTLDNSGAFLAQSIGTGDTTIDVTSATLLTDATTVHIDGTSYVSASDGGWLGSTGRPIYLADSTVKGDSINYAYATLGWDHNGPTGSGILAHVTLRADHLGTVSLSLENVLLTDWQADPYTIEVVPNASVTVVSGNPTPPSPPSPDCGGSGTKVCILPSTQQVGVGHEFTVYIAAQNVPTGLGLGSYQFRLKWSPATEEMTVQSLHRGYLHDDGSNWYRNTQLTTAIDSTTTNLPLTNVDQLSGGVGWTAKLWPDTGEEMLIVGVNASPPSIDVVRGYNGTTPTGHGMNDVVYAGPERMTVTRAALPAPHSAGVDFRDNLRVLHVSNSSLLTASALQIDNERFKVSQVPARTLHDTGLTLSSAINDTVTTFSVSGSGSVQKGWALQVDSELMLVTNTGSGTVTVVRGTFGSQAASHNAAAALKSTFAETNTVRTVRGFQSTTIASHSAGAAITDVDGLGGYGFTAASPGVPSDVDFVWAKNGAFLGQTGRTPACNPPTFPSGTVSFQCDTTGTLPLGPTGSGTLATVDVTGHRVLTGAPQQALNLSGVTLHDISGDSLSVGTTNGNVRVVGCPDFDDNRNVTFTGDVIAIARAVLVNGNPDPYPTEPEMDLDGNGSINFIGDVILAAQIAQGTSPTPLHCPPGDW
jgi:hypothetical protein